MGCQSWRVRRPTRISYLVIGTLFYRNAFDTNWSYVDAVYFTMVTISTVGYGDLSPGPDKPGMQIFTVFYIVIGITIIFPQEARPSKLVIGTMLVRPCTDCALPAIAAGGLHDGLPRQVPQSHAPRH